MPTKKKLTPWGPENARLARKKKAMVASEKRLLALHKKSGTRPATLKKAGEDYANKSGKYMRGYLDLEQAKKSSKVTAQNWLKNRKTRKPARVSKAERRRTMKQPPLAPIPSSSRRWNDPRR